MACRFLTLAALALLWPAATALAQPRAPSPSEALRTSTPVQPWAVQFDLRSRISGRTYRIYVHKPDAPPPRGGYPVITFVDGNVSFPIATIAGLFAEVEGRGNALIVGVGYPSDDLKALTIRRNRDLTPTQPPGGIQQYPGYLTMTSADFGGAEQFHRFLVEELRPRLAAAYTVDPANQTLAGHSLGGLFTLTVLLRHPSAYRSYVAMSPAIWWNDRAILAETNGFARDVAARKLAPRLLVTAGSEEDDIPAALPPGPAREAFAANLRKNGILGNARALTTELAAAAGSPGYVVRFQPIAGEHHNTSMPDAIVRAIAFALAPPEPAAP